MNYKVIIIGGMAAGCKTAARLSRLSPEYEIIIVERNSVISYGSCGMPMYASGEVDDFYDLAKTGYDVIRNEDFFESVKNVKVLTNTEVQKIENDKKQLYCSDLKNGKSFTLKFDALVFATGSEPIKPNFEYPNVSNVSTFFKPQDAKNFREKAQIGKVDTAVIIGGGFIGCELTETLTSLWGISTTLIEKESFLLKKIVDPEISNIIKNRIKKNDVKLFTECEVEKIIPDDDEALKVILTNGQEILTDYVFLNIGVKPNGNLASVIGIKTGSNGGIIVNENMKTNLENIWAAGDCNEIKNLVTGQYEHFPLASLSNRMGRVAADSIAKINSEFIGAVGCTSLKIFDLTLCTAGITQTKAEKLGYNAGSMFGSWPDRPDYHPETKDLFIKVIYNKPDLRLLGIQAVGEGEVTRYVDVCSQLLIEHKTAYDLLNLEHCYTPANSSPISPLNNLGYMILNQENEGINNINPLDLDSFEGRIIDLREEVELNAMPLHLNSLKFTNAEIIKHIDEFKDDKPVLMVCQKGPRSYEAAVKLKQHGLKNVSYLGGGLGFYYEMNLDKKFFN